MAGFQVAAEGSIQPLRMNTVNLPRARGLNPKSHRLGPFDRHRSRGCAALDYEECNRVPNWISLKLGFEQEIGVTESWKVPGCCE